MADRLGARRRRRQAVRLPLINEYGDSLPEVYAAEVWHAFTRGTFLDYWWGTHDLQQRQKALAAVDLFQSVINKADFGRFTPHPIIDERLVGRPHRDYIAYYADLADPLYITELADPTDRFDVRWYDPVDGLKQVEVRPGGAQEFRAPGRGTWVLHVNRHELPPGRWLDESFDLADGPLAGQHGVQLGRWYDIHCDIDLDAGTVSVSVDGAQTVTGYAMKDGPITDVQLMGFVGDGTVLVDDLRGGAVRFFDVPPWHPFHDAIETLARNGITAGCGPSLFCPDAAISRAELAVFLLRTAHGPLWLPPAATGVFPDVPTTSGFAPWIEAAYRDGVIGSCSQLAVLYCPDGASTRAAMAGYLLRAKHGGSYLPPPPSFAFADVSHRDPQVGWIDELYREQITAGCAIDPLRYCPSPTVSRGEIAAFLVAAFALP